MSIDLIAWEWYRDKETKAKHRRLAIPRDEGKKKRFVALLVDALKRSRPKEESKKENE